MTTVSISYVNTVQEKKNILASRKTSQTSSIYSSARQMSAISPELSSHRVRSATIEMRTLIIDNPSLLLAMPKSFSEFSDVQCIISSTECSMKKQRLGPN